MHKLSWWVLCVALGGCSQPTLYQRQILTLAPAWQLGSEQLAAAAGPWWQAFDDPQLNQLVEAVLAANPDMRIAALKLRSARLATEQADTNLTPSVNGSLGASGNKDLTTGKSSSSMGPSLGLSYELDLWGKLDAVRDQASWEAAASEQDLASTRLLLIGNTLEQYWQLGYLASAMTLSEQQLANLARTTQLTEVKFRAGAVTSIDVAQTRQQQAAKQAELASLKAQQELARNALRLLLGRSHGELEYGPVALPSQPIPELAIGMPADLLARRPDVKAAELRLRKTLARGDEIRTGFYPSLTLTGSASTVSDRLAQVLQNPVGSLGATLALPFLEYNRTRLAIASSTVDYQIAETEFRKQLYSALVEVEDSLAARHYGQQRLGYLQTQFEYAQQSERLAGARFQAGETGVQVWLDEQNRLWDAELALLAQQKEQLSTMAKIYRAVGGSDS
ncbi:efflux transporter outer membrane subunit [Aeromonas cavernicola]|uniref:Transporter n=1 Tax=Aeromonas cavernicola TaxID=1006623 RepID=A0A2H9U4I7_9GAMM|nr:TolC family protein [Aeromonas cavernicola]PJG58921.1 transporter [Aeromonas cavernicola]